jgi:hypothetical protein
MKTTFLSILFLLCAIMACNDPKPKDTAKQPVERHELTDDVKTGTADPEAAAKYRELLVPLEETFEGFVFKFGYRQYDEDKFGFSNPGYLQVLKNGKIIFEDIFKGEGEVSVHSLGYHELSGRKLAFKLDYGTNACDYSQTSRYYVIGNDRSITFIKDYWSGVGGDGYASRYYEAFFPEDSLGEHNTLKIVEGIEFLEHDQPDAADTTYVVFEGDRFAVNKPTDNMSKVK